jgi:hypothetical protein
MTLAITTEKRLEREIARVLEIMGHVRDRPEGLNKADTKAAFIDPILSALGWELRGPVTGTGTDQEVVGKAWLRRTAAVCWGWRCASTGGPSSCRWSTAGAAQRAGCGRKTAAADTGDENG